MDFADWMVFNVDIVVVVVFSFLLPGHLLSLRAQLLGPKFE